MCESESMGVKVLKCSILDIAMGLGRLIKKKDSIFAKEGN